MKYKIIADSSCNLTNDYINDENIGFGIASLVINADGIDFVDDENIDVDALLKAVNGSKNIGRSSCPSPYSYSKMYEDANIIIVVTISGKLSGSYNSAISAIEVSNNKNVIVIDSKGTGPSLDLIVDKAYELCKEDKLGFNELEKTLTEYRDSLELLFVIDKFDNLVKNGRMSKIVALLATTLSIKPLCIANDGNIKIHEKIRTKSGALKRLVASIKSLKKEEDYSTSTCIISYVKNEEDVNFVKKLIEANYNFKEIKVIPCRGLCSFYALENSILVGFN